MVLITVAFTRWEQVNREKCKLGINKARAMRYKMD